MADIEKIRKGLKACSCHELQCTNYCPYKDKCYAEGAQLRKELFNDISDFIEEQEQTIKNMNEIIQKLNQHIKDLSEYMTPYGMLKDVKAYAELLKEQEAVEPKKLGRLNLCSRCEAVLADYINKDIHFCYKCGQGVKWE